MEPPRADAVAGLVVSVAFWQGGEFAATGLFAGRDQQRRPHRDSDLGERSENDLESMDQY